MSETELDPDKIIPIWCEDCGHIEIINDYCFCSYLGCEKGSEHT